MCVIDAVVNIFVVDFIYVYILYWVVTVVGVMECIVWSGLFFALTDLLYKHSVLYHTHYTMSTYSCCQHLF